MAPDAAKRAQDDLVQYYFCDPFIESLTDQEPIGGTGPPDLNDMLDAKRRIQPSSHWIAGVLQITTPSRRIRKIIQALPADGGGLTFIKGTKQDERSEPRITSFETSALKGYNRDHHTEVVAVAYAEAYLHESPIEVELYDPHFPCISCVGSIKQFLQRHPQVTFVHGYDDWANLQNALREERIRRSKSVRLPCMKERVEVMKQHAHLTRYQKVSAKPRGNGLTYYPILDCKVE